LVLIMLEIYDILGNRVEEKYKCDNNS
jgi:hypothetical protein